MNHFVVHDSMICRAFMPVSSPQILVLLFCRGDLIHRQTSVYITPGIWYPSQKETVRLTQHICCISMFHGQWRAKNMLAKDQLLFSDIIRWCTNQVRLLVAYVALSMTKNLPLSIQLFGNLVSASKYHTISQNLNRHQEISGVSPVMHSIGVFPFNNQLAVWFHIIHMCFIK